MAQMQRSISVSKTKIIQHPTHPKHPLQELTNSTEYLCDGCHALGSGTRYNCIICEFDLHDFCASCPATLSSHLHPDHPLHLGNKVVDDRFCDLCGDLVNGLFYSCEECEVDLHPLCSLLPLTAKHPMHPQHILKLQPEKPSWCAVCRQLCDHWRYRCNTCCLDIHPECVLGSSDASDNESETRAVVDKPSQAQPPPGSYKDASGHGQTMTTRGMVVPPVQGAIQPPPGSYKDASGQGQTMTPCGMVVPPVQGAIQPPPGSYKDASGQSLTMTTRGMVVPPVQGAIQPPPRKYDTNTRALAAQPYQAPPPPGYNVFGSDSATRALVAQHYQAQPRAESFIAAGGLTTSRMVAPVQPSSGYNVGVPFGGLPMQMNQGFYMGLMQPMMYYQGQGPNSGVLGMQGMSMMYNQGQGMIGSRIGMDQPGSSNNNEGENRKPKMGVKRKIYLAAKIAASVATLATTGVPLGLFLSSA